MPNLRQLIESEIADFFAGDARHYSSINDAAAADLQRRLLIRLDKCFAAEPKFTAGWTIPEAAHFGNINALCPLSRGLIQTEYASAWNSFRYHAMAKNIMPPAQYPGESTPSRSVGWADCRMEFLRLNRW